MLEVYINTYHGAYLNTMGVYKAPMVFLCTLGVNAILGG